METAMEREAARAAAHEARSKGNRWAGLAAPLAAVILMWALGAFTSLEPWLEDMLYQHPAGAAEMIFVIGIDERTLDEMGPFGTWSRAGVARLVEILTADPETAPAIIGLDIGFYGQIDPENDERLAAACAAAGNVVTVGAVTLGTVPEKTDQGAYEMVTKPVLLEKPFPALEAAVSWGHANISMDADGVVRRSLHAVTYGGEAIESFAAALYRAYTGREANPPLDAGGQWRIPYAARPYAYYGVPGSGASLARVLRGEYPVEAFQGAIVLVGAYAQGLQDSFDTPVSRNLRMNGVEVHANILQALLAEKTLRPVPFWIASLVCGALWAACLCVLWALRFRVSIPSALLLAAGYVFGASLLSKSGWMLPVALPVAGFAGMTACGFAFEFISMWWERRQLVANFSRYLPPEVARHIAERGEKALRLGGFRRSIAVLFVDIRGFTSLSERLEPEAMVSILNRFLVLTTMCVFKYKGTVDKFIGDSTMGLFNAPEELPDYTLCAVRAALEMIEKARALTEELAGQGVPVPGIGVGIHCGDAVVGNVGTEHRMEYTAIGDTVNTASRLEGQAQAGEIIISEAVYAQVKDHVECAYLGERNLRGKAEPIPLWRVEAAKANTTGTSRGVEERC